MPAPLAMPPMVEPSRSTTAVFATCVGRADRLGCSGARPRRRTSEPTAADMPPSSLSIGSRTPIRPVEQTATSAAEVVQHLGDLLGGGVRVLEALGSGAGVGAAGVQDHGLELAGLEDLLGPEHRRGLDPVAGEHGGRGAVGPVVDHEGQVGLRRRA